MRNAKPWLGWAAVAASLAACQTSGIGPATQTAQGLAVRQTEVALHGTESALAAMETELAAPPTPTEVPTPAATPTRLPSPTPGPLVITDDFAGRSPLWPDCGVCEWSQGELVMGPYPVSSSHLSGYLALCAGCGAVQDYSLGVDGRFLNGYTDRGYGLVLWYDDATGSYIDLEITTWQVYGVWVYDGQTQTWSSLTRGWLYSPALYPSYGANRVDVSVHDGTAEIRLNDVSVVVVEGMPASPGRVGLMVALHAMQVAFDNFRLEIPKGEAPGGGTT
jgi:hypothetical protein